MPSRWPLVQRADGSRGGPFASDSGLVLACLSGDTRLGEAVCCCGPARARGLAPAGVAAGPVWVQASPSGDKHPGCLPGSGAHHPETAGDPLAAVGVPGVLGAALVGREGPTCATAGRPVSSQRRRPCPLHQSGRRVPARRRGWPYGPLPTVAAGGGADDGPAAWRRRAPRAIRRQAHSIAHPIHWGVAARFLWRCPADAESPAPGPSLVGRALRRRRGT